MNINHRIVRGPNARFKIAKLTLCLQHFRVVMYPDRGRLTMVDRWPAYITSVAESGPYREASPLSILERMMSSPQPVCWKRNWIPVQGGILEPSIVPLPGWEAVAPARWPYSIEGLGGYVATTDQVDPALVTLGDESQNRWVPPLPRFVIRGALSGHLCGEASSRLLTN